MGAVVSNDPEYLTIQEVRKLLKVSRGTVYNMIKRGLPVHKSGRIVRIRKDELQEFMRQQGQEE